MKLNTLIEAESSMEVNYEKAKKSAGMKAALKLATEVTTDRQKKNNTFALKAANGDVYTVTYGGTYIYRKSPEKTSAVWLQAGYPSSGTRRDPDYEEQRYVLIFKKIIDDIKKRNA